MHKRSAANDLLRRGICSYPVRSACGDMKYSQCKLRQGKPCLSLSGKSQRRLTEEQGRPAFFLHQEKARTLPGECTLRVEIWRKQRQWYISVRTADSSRPNGWDSVRPATNGILSWRSRQQAPPPRRPGQKRRRASCSGAVLESTGKAALTRLPLRMRSGAAAGRRCP